jgi:hypothetical protein
VQFVCYLVAEVEWWWGRGLGHRGGLRRVLGSKDYQFESCLRMLSATYRPAFDDRRIDIVHMDGTRYGPDDTRRL